MKFTKSQISILLIILLELTIACNLLSNAGADQSGDDNNIPNGIELGGSSQWPDYLPDDIPVLGGDIQLVMGSADTKVRIFYDSFSDKQVEQYIDLCRENGYEIVYLVYTREGFPDRSEEKMKAGEYDAVEMTKGEYRMRLEYGSDSATLDIYLPKPENSTQPSAVPLQWPQDIAESVPQPEYCIVTNIANLSMGGYQIVCEYEDGDIRLNDYLAVLDGLGFKETERLINDQNEIVYLIYENSTLSVKLSNQDFAAMITFQVTPIEP